MGWLDSVFGTSDTPQVVGEKILTSYFNEASTFSNFNYPSYDSWLAFLVSKVPDVVDLIGELVISNSAATTIDQAVDRVVHLANESGGEDTISQIVQAAGGKGDTVNWAAGIPEIIHDTAVDTAELAVNTAQNIGVGVTSSLNMLKYLPWILGAGAVIYIGVLAKTHGKMLKLNPRRKKRRRK